MRYNWELAPDTAARRIGDGTAAFYNYIYYGASYQVRHLPQPDGGMIGRDSEGTEGGGQENRPRFEHEVVLRHHRRGHGTGGECDRRDAHCIANAACLMGSGGCSGTAFGLATMLFGAVTLWATPLAGQAFPCQQCPSPS